MGLSGGTLGNLMIREVQNQMASLRIHPGYNGPLGQDDPSYYREFMMALGRGTVIQTSGKLKFVAENEPAPTPENPIIGIGLEFNAGVFAPDLYRRIHSRASRIGSGTAHEPYPPSSKNSGMYLKALCDGIGIAIRKHYIARASLETIEAGTDPIGIDPGLFSGVSAPAVAKAVKSYSPRLQGMFYPIFLESYSEAYVRALHKFSPSATMAVWRLDGVVY